MGTETGIEWTDSTWNPTRGCTRVSEGCVNCYAEIMASRFSSPGQWGEGFAAMKGGDHRWSGKVSLVESQLGLPLRWKKARRIFVNSTSDLFHEALADDAIDRVFAVMAMARQHTYQILTKRPERMRAYFKNNKDGLRSHAVWRAMYSVPGPDHWFGGPTQSDWPLPNVWLGVSVEDQERADERIPPLLDTPATVRFISAEPLLGAIDLWGARYRYPKGHLSGAIGNWGEKPRLDWVIVGGESGPNSRAFNWEWGHNIMKQCAAAGVACFVKQYGSNPVGPLGSRLPLKDKKGGDWLEWPEVMRVRQFPNQGVTQ